MKKKNLILSGLIFLLGLTACQGTNIISSISVSSSTSSSQSNVETTSSSNQTSLSTSSSSPITVQTSSNNSSWQSSSSSNSADEKISVKYIRQKAENYLSSVNEVGVYESTEEVEIDLQLIAVLDAITTKQGYGSRYKALMSDGEDYIYVKITDTEYKNLKKYVTERQTYHVKGVIGLYNKTEAEIISNGEIEYIGDEIILTDYLSLADELSLSDIYEDLNNLTLNCKGVAYSSIIKTKVTCLAKDINSTNLYFGNGQYIINVHGNDKVTNNFTKGSSYILIGALSVYNYRPSLEYVYSEPISEEITFDYNNALSLKASEFYNYTYQVDEEEKYPEYTKFFETPKLVEGYINYYLKDGKGNLVLTDNYYNSPFSTIENAKSAKSIMLDNENCRQLTDSNVAYCPLYEYALEEIKVSLVVFPYMWNTSKYPMVYCYNFSI